MFARMWKIGGLVAAVSLLCEISPAHAQGRGRSGGGLYIQSGGLGIGLGIGSGGRGGYYGPGRGGFYGPSRSGLSIQIVPGGGPRPYGYAPAPVYVPAQRIAQPYDTDSPPVEPTPMASGTSVGQRTSLPGVSFGARAHLEVLANAIIERTAQLRDTLAKSYADSPDLPQLDRDTELLTELARQITPTSAKPEATREIVGDMLLLVEQMTPIIERSTPSGNSASGPLSSVQSAVKLLSIDAGYVPGQVPDRPASAAPTGQPEPTPLVPVPE
ncbi:MAG: hypothetical protein DWH91_19100 [Planctomycetota bacterium]|nr:MAG: hypothetical protein DWH91_19100 [Planctomycetota bacterium]